MNRSQDLRRLLILARPFWGWMVLSGLLGFMTVGSSVGLMATGAWLLSAAALHPSIAALQVAIVGVRFFGIARGGFRYVERLTSHHITFKLLRNLRMWFYERLEPLAPAVLVDRTSGDLLGRMLSDVEGLQHLYMRITGPLLVALLTGAGMLVFTGLYVPVLAGLLLACYLLAGVGVPLLVWRMADRPGREVVAARAALNDNLVAGIQGVGDLLAYGADEHHRDRVGAISQWLTHHQQALVRIDALQEGLLTLLSGGAVVLILAAAVGRVNGINLAAVVLGVAASFEVFAGLGQVGRHLGGVTASARRLFEVLDEAPAVQDTVLLVEGSSKHTAEAAHDSNHATEPPSYDLQFDHLTFTYTPNAPPALRNINLEVKEGQRIAIVGTSGAGKSTLIHLLLRFWDVAPGMIRVGGQDVRHYPPETVRRWFAVVPQRSQLFNATIRENLLIAQPGASNDDLIAACQQAHLHHFVASLPDGYDTYIGDRGTMLSGGERQRLALARALLKDAPILLLDEPTANLDVVTEQAVMDTLLTTVPGRSLLVITHRLTMMDAFDTILLLNEGRIVARGRHAELPQHNSL